MDHTVEKLLGKLQTANPILTNALTVIMMSKGTQVSSRIFISKRVLLRQEGPVNTVITCRAVCVHAQEAEKRKQAHP